MDLDPFLDRLRRDVDELQEFPCVGIDVFVKEGDQDKLCLILTPPSGPWKGLRLHFDVALSYLWPAIPPSVYCSVPEVEHPNLFGGYVSCDLLRAPLYTSHGYEVYDGKYTPALSLRELFIQLLTLFSRPWIRRQGKECVEICDYTTAVLLSGSEIGDALVKGIEHVAAREPDTQLEMRRRWHNHPSPTALLASYRTGSQEITHLTKPAIPDHPCLHLVQKRNPRWLKTLELIQGWNCPTCHYDSAAQPHLHKENTPLVTALTVVPPPSSCFLDTLPYDILIELASILPTESLISMTKAYPRFRWMVDTAHLLVHRELVCFFFRTPLLDCVLGIAIKVDWEFGTLSSDYRWLSEEAFENYVVDSTPGRRSQKFSFLPLAFSQVHFDRVCHRIWNALESIDEEIGYAEDMADICGFEVKNPRLRPSQTTHGIVGIIFELMGNSVLSIMDSYNNAITGEKSEELDHALDRWVYSYTILLHLLLCFCRKVGPLLNNFTTDLQHFLECPPAKSNELVPNFGEFIAKATVVMALPDCPVTWQALCSKMLQEMTVRSVRWVLEGAPELQVLEIGESRYRLEKTFELSKTELRSMMLQVSFLNLFVNMYGGDLGRLDANFGLAEQSMVVRMVRLVKEIYRVKTWPDFFRGVKYAKGSTLSISGFSDMLREAVRESIRRRYHRAAPPATMKVLKAQRQRVDKDIVFPDPDDFQVLRPKKKYLSRK